MWVDTHCHLDAPEFGADHVLADRERALARERGVALCVLPAVRVSDFDAVQALAHRLGDAYALGVHPLCVPDNDDEVEQALQALDRALQRCADDARLVAVGEIGLDHAVPALQTPAARARQWRLYTGQLRLAHRYGLPVLLHVRKSVDAVLKGLREARSQGRTVPAGIAHAFNGSLQQAQAFRQLGFCLGFGGAMTYDAARQLRRLVQQLPLDALVLETDAPDMPPQWLYVTAAERLSGRPQGLNSPAELPRIAASVAQCRATPVAELAQATTHNACVVLPRLRGLWPQKAEPCL